MKQVSNQSGITLIEILATLTITAIIGSVVYAVLFQTLHANEKTKSHNELRQEANIVMTQLRTMHEKGESIWYSSDMLYTDKNQENLLATEPYHFVEAQIKNLDNSNIMKLDKNSKTTIEYPLLSKSTLEVSFTIADNYGNKYNLETVLPSQSDLSINIDVSKPGYTFPPKLEGCIKPSEFFPKIYPTTTCVDGNSLIPSSENVIVNGTLYISGDLKLDNGNQGNNGETTLTINKNGTEGDFIVTGTLNLLNHTLVNVTNGKAYFNGIVTQPNASLTIIGDAHILGTTVDLKSNTSICIKGTLYSKTDLNVNIDPSLSCSNPTGGIYAKAYQKIN